jgi:vacuolar-type H+-ATPase subunit E/Vma4
MALDNILNKIDENASFKAKDIENKARAQAQGIINKAEAEAEQLKVEIVKQESSRIDGVLQRTIVSARLKSKGEILEHKREKVDACFNKALEGLIHLEDDLYRRLIGNMLSELNFKGKAEVVFSDNDKSRINADFVRGINPELALVFSDELRAGFILKGKGVRFDNSFEKILASRYQALEPAVAKILFSA